MPAAIDYAQPPSRRYSKTLARSAFLSLLYPLVPVACLYGEWLLTWWILGHAPRGGIDEAGTVRGAAWVHELTLLALVLSFPAAVACLALNVVHLVVNQPPLAQMLVRVALLIVLWIGLYVLIRSDPGGVYVWWVID